MVECMPDEYRAEAIISAIGPKNFPGARLLLPRALVAREVLPETIRALGGTIDVVEAYRTEAPESAETATLAKRLSNGEISAVTFTSSSTVTNFLALFDTYGGVRLLEGVVVACIGPITADTARQAGLATEVVAKDYTIEGLVEALVKFFAVN
jgi:uroporphyrinogen III methyltransferase/synthase